MDAKELIDRLGHGDLAAALGVAETTVRISVYQGRGKLPPAWFAACEKLAREKSVDCPRDAFNFKTATPQDSAA